jgi:glycosyltransferase involved in cell wall biosynthesis
MRILMQKHNNYGDGVSTYIHSLGKVLSAKGHEVCHKNTKDEIEFDLIFNSNQTYYKRPTVSHVHNAIIKNKQIIKNMMEYPDVIVTVNSEFQRKQIGNKAVILPNCIDEDMFKPVKISSNNKILYFGRVAENNKNTIIPLLEVVKNTDYELTMIGDVDDYMSKVLKNYDGINIFGNLNPKSITDIVKEHSIGFAVGRSAMELILMGLPVMLFGLGYEGWITEHNAKRLHKEANMTTRMSKPLSMDEKIERILKDIDMPKTLSREKAVEIFGLRHNIFEYENLFKKMAKKA